MSDLQRLLDIEEIKVLFARRVRYLDQKQWDKYGSCHTEDAWSESYGDLPPDLQPRDGGTSNRVVGPAALAETIRRFCDEPVPMITCHQVHQPEIEFQSATEATGIWPMEDILWWRNGDRDESLHGYGHYNERYRKEDGRWLIAYRRLDRLRVETTPGFWDRLRTNA